MREAVGAMNRRAVLLLLLGVLLLSFGGWLILPAVGFIVAGVLVTAAGVLLLDVRGDRS